MFKSVLAVFAVAAVATFGGNVMEELEKETLRDTAVENYVSLIEKGVDIDPVFNQVSAKCLNNAANAELPDYFTCLLYTSDAADD